MKRIVSMLLVAVATLCVAAPPREQPVQRKSPHETISRKIENNRVTIVYGRPYTRDPRSGEPRRIWGALVPYDKIWRLGADEATLLVTQKPIDLGNAALPAGAYTLFMIPAADGSAMLLVNREIGQFGIDPYDMKAEIARIPLKREILATPVDQFTICIENGAEKGGELTFSWENVEYSVPFRVRHASAPRTSAK